MLDENDLDLYTQGLRCQGSDDRENPIIYTPFDIENLDITMSQQFMKLRHRT